MALGLRVMWSGTSLGTVPPAATDPLWLGGMPQGHVYTGVCEEPDDVNPLTAHTQVAKRMVHAYTHEALLDIDPVTGGLRPALAESFEPAADGMSCTFTLRAGVRFADGSELTLDDVLFPWQLRRAGHLAFGAMLDAFDRVADVEVLDSRRIRVHFRERHYASVRIVGETWLVPCRAWFLARVAARVAPAPMPAIDSAQFAEQLAAIKSSSGPGTGPYQLLNQPEGPMNWKPRQELLLVRNPHCWRRTASPGTWNFAGIRLLFRLSTAATMALLRGEIDWFTSFGIDELVTARPELATDHDRLDYDYESLGVYRTVWNCARPSMHDARVRRALAMLFDIDSLLARDPAAMVRAVAHAKPDAPAYPRAVKPIAFDPPAARALLREAGHDPERGTPLRLRLVAMAATDVLRRIIEHFEDAAGKAGVELTVVRCNQSGFIDARNSGDWDGILVLQSFRPWGDPAPFLRSGSPDNIGKFADERMDGLLDRAQRELDPAARARLWIEAHELAHAEQPVALLVHPKVSMLLAKRIEGESIGRTGLVLERAFVAPERQRQ